MGGHAHIIYYCVQQVKVVGSTGDGVSIISMYIYCCSDSGVWLVLLAITSVSTFYILASRKCKQIL